MCKAEIYHTCIRKNILVNVEVETTLTDDNKQKNTTKKES